MNRRRPHHRRRHNRCGTDRCQAGRMDVRRPLLDPAGQTPRQPRLLLLLWLRMSSCPDTQDLILPSLGLHQDVPGLPRGYALPGLQILQSLQRHRNLPARARLIDDDVPRRSRRRGTRHPLLLLLLDPHGHRARCHGGGGGVLRIPDQPDGIRHLRRRTGEDDGLLLLLRRLASVGREAHPLRLDRHRTAGDRRASRRRSPPRNRLGRCSTTSVTTAAAVGPLRRRPTASSDPCGPSQDG